MVLWKPKGERKDVKRKKNRFYRILLDRSALKLFPLRSFICSRTSTLALYAPSFLNFLFLCYISRPCSPCSVASPTWHPPASLHLPSLFPAARPGLSLDMASPDLAEGTFPHSSKNSALPPLYLSVWAAVTEYYRLTSLNTFIVSQLVPEDRSLTSKCYHSWFLVRTLPLPYSQLPSHCILPCLFSGYVCRESVLVSLLIRTPAGI